MHAFEREQPGDVLAVLALCKHIATTKALKQGQARQCMGCLVALGESMDTDDAWR